jgi:adenosylmethionine-8-amino-7-oxononanoate aminotransferase
MRIVPADGFRMLADACAETGVLLICDEVATGFGRTGALFASELCDLRPDLMVIGKGLTGGYLPMAATISNGRVYDAFLGEDLGPKTLYHGHSYSGNALAAAVALRHLELILEGDVLGNVRTRSAQLRSLLDERISPLDAVVEARLQGLMCGVELQVGSRRGVGSAGPQDRVGRRVCAVAVARGVLLRPLGDVVVIMPPLTISSDEIERIVDVLRDSILEVARP